MIKEGRIVWIEVGIVYVECVFEIVWVVGKVCVGVGEGREARRG